MSFEPTSPAAQRPPKFHAEDVESLDDYRTLSVLAVVSLVVGLLSPLAFSAPLARIIPIIGIGVALVALRRIAVSDGMLAGRGAAMAGLALSVVSLLAVLTYSQVMRHLLVAQAEEFGRNWLLSVQAGDTRGAFRLTSQGAQPEPPPDGPAAAPKNPYDEFLASPVIRRLTESGDGGRVDLETTHSYERPAPGQGWVGQRFIVTPGAASPAGAQQQAAPFRVDLRLQRGQLAGEDRPRWLVWSYRDVDASAESATENHAGHAH